MKNSLPEQIYLQCYEDDGSLLNLIRDDVTRCVDQINENDAVYILATPKLAALLERLANDAEYVSMLDEPYRYMTVSDTEAARALAARIREALEEEVKCTD